MCCLWSWWRCTCLLSLALQIFCSLQSHCLLQLRMTVAGAGLCQKGRIQPGASLETKFTQELTISSLPSHILPQYSFVLPKHQFNHFVISSQREISTSSPFQDLVGKPVRIQCHLPQSHHPLKYLQLESLNGLFSWVIHKSSQQSFFPCFLIQSLKSE